MNDLKQYIDYLKDELLEISKEIHDYDVEIDENSSIYHGEGIKLFIDKLDLTCDEDPRDRFNNWQKRNEGKKFKILQFQRQNGKCANPQCQKDLKLKSFNADYSNCHLHHNLSLKNHNNDANFLENLVFLCADCNLSFGNKDTNFFYDGQNPPLMENRTYFF